MLRTGGGRVAIEDASACNQPMGATKRILLVLLVLALFAFVGSALAFDSIVRKAIEAGGRHALGVETTLAELDVGLISGGTSLGGLEIDNPAGFEAEHFLRLGGGELSSSLRGLAGELVTVDLLAFSDIELAVERRQGRTNYGVILDHLEALGGEPSRPPDSGPSTEPSTDPAEEPGKRFLVRRVEFKGVRVSFDLLPAGGQLTRANVTIPSLVLEDVGNQEGGASLEELAGELVRALLQASMEAGGSVLSPELLADLRGKLEGLGLQELQLEGVQAELEGLVPDLEAAADELGDDAQEALEEAARSLEGLFKKD